MGIVSATTHAAFAFGGGGGGDTTAPTLVSAIVSNSTPSQIDLTWSEPMNSTVSASSAFAVSAGHTLTAHTYVDSTHSYLTTSSAFTNGETTRTLDYTQPGSNKMQDLAGNLLANFSGTAITNNVSENTVTADFTLSRSSGAAPFALYVNARSSTSNITQANNSALGGTFRQLNYDWNFGDPSAGNHAVSGLPRNTQNGGPIAAKVYDGVADGAATSFTITLTVTAGHPWRTHASTAPTAYVVGDLVTQGGDTYVCATSHTPGTFSTDLAAAKWTLFQTGLIQNSKALSVAVTSGNTTYPTTATIYVSPSANYGSAPSGSTLRTTLPTMASNKRILLRNGEGGYGDFDIGGLTDCMVIGVGAGAKAACARVSMSGTRNVVQGISTTLGITAITGTDNMMIGNTIAHSDTGATTIGWGANFTDVYTNCVRAFMVGNTVVGNSNSIASMYGGGRDFVIMDNAVGDAVQHTLRCYGNYGGYIAHNQFNGPVIDGSKLTVKHHSLGLVQWPTTSSGGLYASEFFVEADNIMGHTSSTNSWTADCCPENFDATTVEGLSDIIYERNIHIRSGTVNTDFLYGGRRITMRGNSIPSGTLNISNVKDVAGSGGVVGSTNSTYRNNWLDNGFMA